MKQLFTHELQDLYSGEAQIIDALPKMIEAASTPELKKAFDKHLEETKEHARRLDQIAQMLNIEIDKGTCKGMEGIIREGKEIIGGDSDPRVKDAALIIAAQRVEHYEIAAYGSARTHAEELGYTDIARILQTTLDEEGATDKTLSSMAMKKVNKKTEQVH